MQCRTCDRFIALCHDIYENQNTHEHIHIDKGIDNRARQLSTPEAR
jgi:hypothetical protein